MAGPAEDVVEKWLWLKQRNMTYHTLYFMLKESPEEDVVEKKGLKKPGESAKTGRCRECGLQRVIVERP